MRDLRQISASWWVKLNDKYTKGLPDVIGVHLGTFYAIELKRKGEKPRPLQEYILEKIRTAGGVIRWFDDYENFKKWKEEEFSR